MTTTSFINDLAGKTVVLTGTLGGMTRAEAAGYIEALGGTVSTSVSRGTSCVVVGALPGSKHVKAKALGVPVLTEAEFLAVVRR